jgi:hypothetical protein
MEATPSSLAPASKVRATTRRVVGSAVRSWPRRAGETEQAAGCGLAEGLGFGGAVEGVAEGEGVDRLGAGDVDDDDAAGPGGGTVGTLLGTADEVAGPAVGTELGEPVGSGPDEHPANATPAAATSAMTILRMTGELMIPP